MASLNVKTPTMIILEAPRTSAGGTHKYPCLVCTQLFRISDKARQTVRDLRRLHILHIVACYGCYVDLRLHLPSTNEAPTDVTTGRRFLGL
jgi:hypothetical protein